MKRQENRAGLHGGELQTQGQIHQQAGRMKTTVPRPMLRLTGNAARSCSRTPGNSVGQRAATKANANGFARGFGCRLPPRWMCGQGGQSFKVIDRFLSDFGAFLLSKLKWAGSRFGLSLLDDLFAKAGGDVSSGV